MLVFRKKRPYSEFQVKYGVRSGRRCCGMVPDRCAAVNTDVWSVTIRSLKEQVVRGLGVLVDGTDPQLASLNYEAYYFDVTGLEQEWIVSRY
jgi:hypothetical protein